MKVIGARTAELGPERCQYDPRHAVNQPNLTLNSLLFARKTAISPKEHVYTSYSAYSQTSPSMKVIGARTAELGPEMCQYDPRHAVNQPNLTLNSLLFARKTAISPKEHVFTSYSAYTQTSPSMKVIGARTPELGPERCQNDCYITLYTCTHVSM
jgi:hypothetical protein